MDLLHIYSTILCSTNNKKVEKYLIKRIFNILKKGFKKRDSADFPKVSHDLQVVNLISYIRENKLPYAFLYASSLLELTQDIKEEIVEKPLGIWGKFKRVLGKLM